MRVATHFNNEAGRFYMADEMGRVYMLDNRNEWVRQRHMVPDDLEHFERVDIDPLWQRHMWRVAIWWIIGLAGLVYGLDCLAGMRL